MSDEYMEWPEDRSWPYNHAPWLLPKYFKGTPKAKPMVHDVRFAADVVPSTQDWSVVIAYRHYRDGTIDMITYTEYKLHGNGWDCIWTMEVANEVGP